MNSVLFDLGFIQIKWYSFFILLGIIVGYIIVRKEAIKKRISEEDLTDIVFYGLIIGILGARIYYVIFNLKYYMNDISEIFMVWHGGLAIHGGLISTLLFLIFYTRKKKINLLLLLDIIVVGIIMSQAIGRWGNFFNSEAFGKVVSYNYLKTLHIPSFIIKGMYINGYYREPTFLYESCLSVIGFIILLTTRKVKSLKTGMLTSIYLLWYGSSRLIIESHRADSLMLGTVRVAQLISIIGIISGIIIIFISIKKNKKYHEDKIYLTQ